MARNTAIRATLDFRRRVELIQKVDRACEILVDAVHPSTSFDFNIRYVACITKILLKMDDKESCPFFR
jgi:hypothetical protein